MTHRHLLRIVAICCAIFGSLLWACGDRTVELLPNRADDTNTDNNNIANTDPSSPDDTGNDVDTDSTSPEPTCALTLDQIRIRDIDVGQTVLTSEAETTLAPLFISPVPSSKDSRVAWMGDDGQVHIATLNAADELTGPRVSLAAHDFQDMVATADGGVVLLTRDAKGGGTLNCGNENNLCHIPDPPVPCHDMYLVRFDDTGERWAVKLTSSHEALPPYSTEPDGPSVTMIWWYAHHGRIAVGIDSYAAIFGSAISVSNGECIQIYQGNRMQVVSDTGELTDGGFNWGCSPSGYERILWNPQAHAYVAMCKSQRTIDDEVIGVVAFAPDRTIIRPIDLYYANLSDVVVASNGGYWIAVSDRQEGQPENASGNAEVHLFRFTSDETDIHVTLPVEPAMNARAPHLSTYGEHALLLAHEVSSDPGDLREDAHRALVIQVRDMETGASLSDPLSIPEVTGNRYQSFRAFPDGSVAYASRGPNDTTIRILRVLACPHPWRVP